MKQYNERIKMGLKRSAPLCDLVKLVQHKYNLQIDFVKGNLIFPLNSFEKKYSIPISSLEESITLVDDFKNASRVIYDLVNTENIPLYKAKVLICITKNLLPANTIDWNETQVLTKYTLAYNKIAEKYSTTKIFPRNSKGYKQRWEYIKMIYSKFCKYYPKLSQIPKRKIKSKMTIHQINNN